MRLVSHLFRPVLVAMIAIGMAGAAVDSARAQTPPPTPAPTPSSYPNPGGATVITNSTSHTQTITPQAVNQQAAAAATRIVGQLAGKPPVYDQTFNAPFNSPQVQAAVAQARSAVISAGVPGTTVGEPAMTGQAQSTSTSSSTSDTVTSTSPPMVTTFTQFGPSTGHGCAADSCIPPNGDRGLCTFGGADGQEPSGCEINIPFFVLPGQLEINVNYNTDYKITRTTTNTTTVLTTTTYVLTGTPAAAADFSLTSSARTVTLRQGQTGVFPLTVTASNGYAQTVSLSCSGLPDNSACAFAPASVTPSSTGTASALSISTLGPTTGTVNAQALLRATKSAMMLGPLGGLLLLGRRRRRAVAVGLGAILLAGCGGGGSGSPIAPIRATTAVTTASGTATVTVTGKGADGMTHAITLTLIVTP